VHQSLDQPLADPNAASVDEFSTHAPGPVRAPGFGVKFPDQRREPFAAHHGRRQGSAPAKVLTLTGGTKDFATDLDGESGVNECFDRRVDPLGWWAELPSSALGRRKISTSFSISRILRLALCRLRDSARGTP